MVDASHETFSGNVKATRLIVDMAHSCGVPVEGELGYVAGVEGEDADKHPGEIVYTSVEEASHYAAETDVDFLAVSIGTVHGRMKGEPVLDFERLRQINETLRIPLVIHGGTGLSDKQFKLLIDNGVAKINYYTALADAAGARIRVNASADERKGYTGLVNGIREAMRSEIERCMVVWGSSGQADSVIQTAESWRPVHHLIIFNATADNSRVESILHEGEKVLRGIPGVRRVLTGSSVKDDARYRYTWLIEFVHRKVIDSYKNHPDHVSFADKLFRPIADDRISIDYQEN